MFHAINSLAKVVQAGIAVQQCHQGLRLLFPYSSAILNIFLVVARRLLHLPAVYLCSRQEGGRVNGKSLIFVIGAQTPFCGHWGPIEVSETGQRW